MLRYTYLIRLHFLLQLAQNLIEPLGDLFGRNDKRHNVDAGGDVLDVDLVLCQNFQNLENAARLRGHAGFGDGDDGKALFAGNAGDKAALLGFIVDGFKDHGAGMVERVGVADVERDVFLPHGENRPLVQHLRAYVAKLP